LIHKAKRHKWGLVTSAGAFLNFNLLLGWSMMEEKRQYLFVDYGLGEVKRNLLTGFVEEALDINEICISVDTLNLEQLEEKKNSKRNLWYSPYLEVPHEPEEEDETSGIKRGFIPFDYGCDVVNDQVSWGIEAVRADRANFSGEGIKVSVLDDHIDERPLGLEFLWNEDRFKYRDFVNNGESLNPDLNYHGEACTSIICARDIPISSSNQSQNIRIGLLRNIERLIFARVRPIQTKFKMVDFFKGLNWCVQEGSDVVVMPIGKNFSSMLLEVISCEGDLKLQKDRISLFYWEYFSMVKTLEFLVDLYQKSRGTIFVAAVGNGSIRSIERSPRPDATMLYSIFPSVARNIISVGAIQKYEGDLIVDLNQRRGVDILAPGDGVCAIQNEMISFANTSAATAYAAGVIAQWKEAMLLNEIFFSPSNLMNILKVTSLDLSKPYNPYDRGLGMIQSPTKENLKKIKEFLNQ